MSKYVISSTCKNQIINNFKFVYLKSYKKNNNNNLKKKKKHL